MKTTGMTFEVNGCVRVETFGVALHLAAHYAS